MKKLPLSLTLNQRQICDVELLLNDGFFPLTGFMNQEDYYSVLFNMRLSNGILWPIPITLDVSIEFAEKLKTYDTLQLLDQEGVPLANLNITSIWQPDKQQEAMLIYGTDCLSHPGVHYLFNHTKEAYIGGTLCGLSYPVHYDFPDLRYHPNELRAYFKQMNWDRIVAFQTRNPMHRAHVELTLRAMVQHNTKLLIHPAVGITKPGDVDHFTRVKCYLEVMKYYPASSVFLSLLPLAMRMAGPKEALWHAIIRKNYGCTHFIVGRDHAGPGKDKKGQLFYDPYAAQDLVRKYQDEINIEMIPFQEMVYLEKSRKYVSMQEISSEDEVKSISGTQLREKLQTGKEIPEWFSYPGVIKALQKTFPLKHKQGFALFFTGLSGAGKSTIANAVMMKLMEIDDRAITLLDGDHVRKLLSSELGFSKEHRDLNILRIGYVASEIVKHGGIAICAPIAPYQATRQQVRKMIRNNNGGFVEIYLATPLSVCEQRDRKGLYHKARIGLIPEFTGITAPYEIPNDAELIIDTSEGTPLDAVIQIINLLIQLGYVKKSSMRVVDQQLI